MYAFHFWGVFNGAFLKNNQDVCLSFFLFSMVPSSKNNQDVCLLFFFGFLRCFARNKSEIVGFPFFLKNRLFGINIRNIAKTCFYVEIDYDTLIIFWGKSLSFSVGGRCLPNPTFRWPPGRRQTHYKTIIVIIVVIVVL